MCQPASVCRSPCHTPSCNRVTVVLILQERMVYLPFIVHVSSLLLHVTLIIIWCVMWLVGVQLCVAWCVPDPDNCTAVTLAPVSPEARLQTVVSAGRAHHAWPDITTSGGCWASRQVPYHVTPLRMHMQALGRHHPVIPLCSTGHMVGQAPLSSTSRSRCHQRMCSGNRVSRPPQPLQPSHQHGCRTGAMCRTCTTSRQYRSTDVASPPLCTCPTPLHRLSW